MSRKAAFRIGWIPGVAGIYFNGDELLHRLQPADEALRPALMALAKTLDGRGAETIQLVLEAERWADEQGKPSPGRPRTPEEYREWASTVARYGHEVLGGDPAAGTTRLLGLNLGDLCLTLALEGIVADLRAADPEHELLKKQLAALVEDEARARHGLSLAGRSVGLPPAVEPLVAGAEGADLDALLAIRAEIEAALD